MFHPDRCTNDETAMEGQEDDFWVRRFPASTCLKQSVAEALNRSKDAFKIHKEYDSFFKHCWHYQDAKALLMLFVPPPREKYLKDEGGDSMTMTINHRGDEEGTRARICSARTILQASNEETGRIEDR